MVEDTSCQDVGLPCKVVRVRGGKRTGCTDFLEDIAGRIIFYMLLDFGTTKMF